MQKDLNKKHHPAYYIRTMKVEGARGGEGVRNGIGM